MPPSSVWSNANFSSFDKVNSLGLQRPLKDSGKTAEDVEIQDDTIRQSIMSSRFQYDKDLFESADRIFVIAKHYDSTKQTFTENTHIQTHKLQIHPDYIYKAFKEKFALTQKHIHTDLHTVNACSLSPSVFSVTPS